MNIPYWLYFSSSIALVLLLIASTPNLSLLDLAQYVQPQPTPHICPSHFQIPDPTESCYVRPPPGYELPPPPPSRLWLLNPANLGVSNLNLNTTSDDFAYVRTLANLTDMYARCGAASRPVVIDFGTGAGTGGLAAAALDAHGANGTAVVISIVPIDRTHRAAAIADRALPVLLSKNIPLPDASVDVVHCNLCHQVTKLIAEVERVLLPFGKFVYTTRRRNKLPGWRCKTHANALHVCMKTTNATERESACAMSRALLPTGARRERAHERARALVGELVRAFTVVRAHAEHSRAVDRVLNIDCGSGHDCWRIEKLLAGASVVHTAKDEKTARRLLLAGSVAIRHDWDVVTAPFYPRTFDVAHVACGVGGVGGRVVREIHRVLRPGGFVTILSATCAMDVAPVIRVGGFRVLVEENGVVVGRRIDI